MKLFQFRKPVARRRHRRKKSHKWLARAKNEVRKMPSLVNLEENLMVKAAILCTAGHYSFTISDFQWDSFEDSFFIQNMIWSIEALKKKYPRYLQYAKWVAIKQALDLVENRRKKHQIKADNDHSFTAYESVPSPDMEALMQEEWERHVARYRRPVRVSQKQNALAGFLRTMNRIQESAGRQENLSPDKSVGKMPVDIDGKGTIMMMTPQEHALWYLLTKQKPPSENNGISP